MNRNSLFNPQPTPQPDSVNYRLAASLDMQRNDIMNEWLERVGKDPAIPTDSLTLEQLRDHLPQLFDDLTQSLRRLGSKIVAEQADEDGEEHGATRWNQGFQVAEMLREVMHLRSILIRRLGAFEEDNRDLDPGGRLFLTAKIHRFLDRMGINATEQFLNEGLHQRDCAAKAKSDLLNPK